ncbi:unnamed protein product [Ranitomeya imitator]|uniref:Olfactory receptor n=1 Tax=Ranitomeya imitator TaxID=111125 RepID=A0ABN9KSA3_9NEOB|nr:unnamed protein product [Ranitomeya imitator]
MDNDDSRIRGRLCPSLIGRGNLYDIIVAIGTIMTSTSILCPSLNQIRGISTSGLDQSETRDVYVLYDIIVAVPVADWSKPSGLDQSETRDFQVNNLTVNAEFFLLGFKNGQRSTILLFCLLLVVYCGTICGNLLIIILVSTSKNLHTPMYFFISQLSISDILLASDIVPDTLHILLNNGGTTTFTGCIIQFYFFCVCEIFECFLLTVMSYDRYVAICNPLHYTSTMTSDRCVILAAMCWVFSFSITLMYCITISMLAFCGPDIIDHFFCDIVPLLENSCSATYTIELEVFIMCFPILFIPLTVIFISYINIIVTILRFQSNENRH